jgi:hypothetical protein
MKKYISLIMALMILLGGASVFAEEGSSSVRPESERKDMKGVAALDANAITCVKTALTKREDALTSGYTTYSTAITGAYTARKTALLAAWDSADAKTRRAAVRSADQAFKSTVQSSKKAWNESRRGTWKTFETDRKACAPGVSSSDTGSSGSDSSI